MTTIAIQLLDGGFLPMKSSPGAAGFDLQSTSAGTVGPRQRLRVPLRLKIALPRHLYGRIAPRSGHADRAGIDILAGVIDADYRGEVAVILYNTDENKTFEFARGDKIAQIIFEKYEPDCVFVIGELDETRRNDAGFGQMGGL